MHELHALDRRLEALAEHIHHLSQRIANMALDLTSLVTSVSRNTSVIDSASILIEGFAAKLDAAVAAASNAGATPEQLKQLKDLSTALDTEDDKLAAAVAANTTPVGPPVLSAADQAIKDAAQAAAVTAGATTYVWTDTAGVVHNEITVPGPVVPGPVVPGSSVALHTAVVTVQGLAAQLASAASNQTSAQAVSNSIGQAIVDLAAVSPVTAAQKAAVVGIQVIGTQIANNISNATMLSSLSANLTGAANALAVLPAV